VNEYVIMDLPRSPGSDDLDGIRSYSDSCVIGGLLFAGATGVPDRSSQPPYGANRRAVVEDVDSGSTQQQGNEQRWFLP